MRGKIEIESNFGDEIFFDTINDEIENLEKN